VAKSSTAYDVFVSFQSQDAGVAAEVRDILGSFGLRVFTVLDATTTNRAEDLIWDAIAESQAFVAIVPEKETSASIAFELGAAKAWNKPIYAVASEPTSTRFPTYLHGIDLFPVSRVDEIAREIIESLRSLSEPEQAILVEEYHRVGIPVDQLLLEPKQLSKLAKQFQVKTNRHVSTEEIARMLLRLRKKGSLRPPRI
jgi:hypothetical protein